MRLVCTTTDQSNNAPYALLDIDEKMAERLLLYRPFYNQVMKHDSSLYCLEFFDYRVEYGTYQDAPDEACDGWMRIENAQLVEAMVEAPTMKVVNSGVLWAAGLCNGECFETAELSWKQIEAIAKGEELCDPY